MLQDLYTELEESESIDVKNSGKKKDTKK